MSVLLRWTALAASGLVLIGFLMFATDEADRSSKGQVAKVESSAGAPAPTARGERVREREHGAVREAVDDANDVLLSPFADLVDSNNIWVQRLVPGALALLVYGLGLLVLANYLPKRRHSASDWRAAQPQ
jgi:hypothetical protein